MTPKFSLYMRGLSPHLGRIHRGHNLKQVNIGCVPLNFLEEDTPILQQPTPQSKPSSPPGFTERIGATTYKVNVHFSKTSKEDVQDKIFRLLESEVKKSA